MSSYSVDSDYEQMLVLYTYTDEQPQLEVVGEVEMMEELTSNAELEYDDETDELSMLVHPPLVADCFPVSGPPPSTVDPNLLNSLMGRFSLAQSRLPHLNTGPSIAPRELSMQPEAPMLVASPLGDVGNSVASETPQTSNALLPGKRSRGVPSSFTGDHRPAKARRPNNENTFHQEQGHDSTSISSRLGNSSHTGTIHVASKGRKSRTTGGHKGRRGRQAGGPSRSIAHNEMHLSREGGLPTRDFTFQMSMKPGAATGTADTNDDANVTTAQWQDVSRDSSMEVDSMLSPASERPLSSLPPFPPAALEATGAPAHAQHHSRAGLRLRINTTTASVDPSAVPGARQSKLKALQRIAKEAGTPSSPRSVQSLSSAISTTLRLPEMDMDVDDEARDAEYIPDADDDQDADDEQDLDFTPERPQPRPSTRKAVAPAVSRKGPRRTATRRTRRTTHSAAKEDFCYVRDGMERRYVRGRGDWKRWIVSKLHGPVWCPFCNAEAPGPEDKSQHSRVRDTPKRHLKSCKAFKASRYFARKEKEYLKRKPRAKELEVVQYAAEEAVMENKAAAAMIRCPNDPDQQKLLVEAGLEHADVLQALEPRSTVYKAKHCRCCPFPHFSKFSKEK